MNTFVLGSILLSAGANALVARDGTCCFGITASGSGANGTVDQLTDGQTRVGGSGLNAGTFCIDTNGGITDGQGRGCIITTETTQFQCDDVTTTPTLGFSVGSNGLVAHNGSTTFYICETGGNGENIYLQTGPDVTECTATTLTADNCKNAASSCAVQSSSPASSALASEKPAASSVASSVAPASSVVVASPPTASAVASSAPAEASSPQAAVSTPAVASSAPAVVSSAPAQASSPPATASTTAMPSPVEVSSVKPSSAAVSSPVVSTSSVLAATQTVVPATIATSAASSASATPSVATSSIPTSSSPAAQKPSTSQAATSVKPSSVQTTTQLPTTSVVPHYTNSSTPATQTSTQTSSTAGSCPTTVNTAATYQYPHLIVPVSSASPDTAYGTGYNGIVNSTVSTIFNFDIPSSYSGKTCSLVFLFPLQSQLETSSYTFSGNGAIDFKQLGSVATQ